MGMDAYLKIEGINGEARQKGHDDWIIVDAWEFGSSTTGQAERGGGLIGGKVRMQDFHFKKLTDKATPKLFEACCKGQVFNEIKVHMVRMPENQLAMEYAFKYCLITSYETGGANGDAGVPQESIAFNFEEMRCAYTAMKPDGTVEGMVRSGWNIKQATKI
jgi:type VI secretion system Hcp family effector